MSVRSAKPTVNNVCTQCGAVLSKGARSCIFCETSESLPYLDDSAATRGNLALNAVNDAEWRGELNQRVQAYRARRRKTGEHEGQTELAFAQGVPTPSGVRIEVEDQTHHDHVGNENDFSFTIAIGRLANTREPEDTQLLIDVSAPTEEKREPSELPAEPLISEHAGLYPVASIEERRHAALIDACCLLFAYGGFLALFGSLGGHFTFNKLSAAVCFFTFAFVYVQYFGLFTIFGGTTPGMMVRGLQVACFSGEEPALRHLLWRAAGYMLSAGTLFMGFLWAMWDEDELTWHDRLSGTYLTSPEILAEMEATHTAATH